MSTAPLLGSGRAEASDNREEDLERNSRTSAAPPTPSRRCFEFGSWSFTHCCTCDHLPFEFTPIVKFPLTWSILFVLKLFTFSFYNFWIINRFLSFSITLNVALFFSSPRSKPDKSDPESSKKDSSIWLDFILSIINFSIYPTFAFIPNPKQNINDNNSITSAPEPPSEPTPSAVQPPTLPEQPSEQIRVGFVSESMNAERKKRKFSDSVQGKVDKEMDQYEREKKKKRTVE